MNSRLCPLLQRVSATTLLVLTSCAGNNAGPEVSRGSTLTPEQVAERQIELQPLLDAHTNQTLAGMAAAPYQSLLQRADGTWVTPNSEVKYGFAIGGEWSPEGPGTFVLTVDEKGECFIKADLIRPEW
jgi:hypothetical protein